MVDFALIQSRKLEKAQQFQQQSLFGNYILKWRQRHLFVSLNQHEQSPSFPTIQSEQWLVECLKHSPVRLVRLAPNLGEARINLWAIACLKAKIPVFIRLPSARKIKSNSPLLKLIYRFIDLIAATLLLLALFPAILTMALITCLGSRKSILVWHWGVSHQGKLFRIFKFRTTARSGDNLCSAYLRHWIHKYQLDRLPHLFNVLRGEMSLIEPSFCSLSLFLKNKS